MSDALIVLVPKTGKDPEDCVSYRSISLINADPKLLAKILAVPLTTVIEHLIQADFIPGKGTDINICCLFLNLSANHDNAGTRAESLLDKE